MAVEIRKVTQLAWRRFLATEEGKEGSLWLHEHTPKIDGTGADTIIFSAGKAQGFADALSQITDLLGSPELKQIDPSND